MIQETRVRAPSLISFCFLCGVLLVACATTQQGQLNRPAIGPGSDWLTATPDGKIGLCALRDREDRICGWTGRREVASWLREADSLLAAAEVGRGQTSELELGA